MIRRTEKSLIRGVPVIEDYFKKCVNYLDPIEVSPAEEARREELFRRRFRGEQHLNTQRNQWLRCLSWSELYTQWERHKTDRRVWEASSIADAEKLCRPKELIKDLRAAKAQGRGFVIFSQRTFLSEWALMVTDREYYDADMLVVQGTGPHYRVHWSERPDLPWYQILGLASKSDHPVVRSGETGYGGCVRQIREEWLQLAGDVRHGLPWVDTSIHGRDSGQG